MKKQFGITLIELMITLAVAGILAGVAVPGFTAIIMNNRMATQVNELIGVLAHARSEAVKRRTPVSVCKSSNGSSCTGSGTNWDDGWLVFVNTDNDSPAAVDSGEEVLGIFDAWPDGFTLRGNSTVANHVTYRANGFSNNGTFTVCDSRGRRHARLVMLSLTGRTRIVRRVRSCP